MRHHTQEAGARDRPDGPVHDELAPEFLHRVGRSGGGAGAHRDTAAAQGVHGKRGLLERVRRGVGGVLGHARHAAPVLSRDPIRLEPPHGRRDARSQIADVVERPHPDHAATPVEHLLKGGRRIVPQGRHHPHARDDDPPHDSLISRISFALPPNSSAHSTYADIIAPQMPGKPTVCPTLTSPRTFDTIGSR